jgi:S-DNA-T family DNA segregation ATPase FtsK/SpoIIIE
MAVAPVLLGVAMAVFLRQVYMLALAAFSPVMLLGSYVSDRRYGRKSYARHPDYLLLRVGTGDLPSAAELTDPAADEHRRQRRWLIPDTPVTFLLAERAVAGVAGEPATKTQHRAVR